MIDYHSHLKWDRETNTYDIEDCLKDMRENNIDMRMISALQGYTIQEQNDAVAMFVNKYPDKLLGCAIINPKEKNYISELKRIIEMNCFHAIELDSNEHCYFPEIVPDMDVLMKECEKHSLVVNVFTGWGCRTMPAQWAFYAKRYPKLKMVLLHMGTTDFGYGCIDLVKNSDNLYVETSCMYEFPILRKAFENIPKEKFLFGSHYPHKFTNCSIHTFDLLNLNDELLTCMYYKNAIELLKLNKETNISV
ncbi:MAG: amidohydrolase family protein [Bacilli bacterium]